MPSHVFKRGNGASGCPPGGDCMSLGKWVDGAPGEVGSWAAVDGVPHEEKLIYAGDFYASKDFEDTPNQRRINWGWATIASGPGYGAGAQSMARVLTYHPILKQIIHSPARPEYEKLRTPTPLAHSSRRRRSRRTSPSDSAISPRARPTPPTCDIIVKFSWPTQPGTFGVVVMNGAMTIFVEIVNGQEKGAAGLPKEEPVAVQVGIYDGPPAGAFVPR